MAHNWKKRKDGCLTAEPYSARWYELVIARSDDGLAWELEAISDNGSEDLGRFNHLSDAKEHAAVIEGQITV